MTDIISSIIHTDDFKIISKQDILIMVDTPKKKGIIINTLDKVIVVPGFNVFQDVGGDLPEGEYYLGREGFGIYVYKHNNKIYVSTNNCINNEDSLLRTKILNVGLDITSLELSGISYQYIISHRDDIVASKINMLRTEGQYYYISHHIYQDGSQPTEQFEELRVPKSVANDFLLKGYHQDVPINTNELLRVGEFVNVITSNGQYLRVLSPSYAWRKRVREGDLKIRHGFYKHLTLAMKAKKGYKSTDPIYRADYDEYCKLFPILPYNEPRSIENYVQMHGYIMSYNLGKLNVFNYIYNTWACYLLALPLHLHKEGCNLYNDYFNTCLVCHSYIVDLWKTGTDITSNLALDRNESNAIKRIDDIMKQSAKNIREGSTSTFEKNCQNLIGKERGSTLFYIYDYITKHRN